MAPRKIAHIQSISRSLLGPEHESHMARPQGNGIFRGARKRSVNRFLYALHCGCALVLVPFQARGERHPMGSNQTTA